jgi:hypothetical protein
MTDSDPLRHLEAITPQQWATLPRALRVTYNKLRAARGLPRLPDSDPVPTVPPAWWARLPQAVRQERNRRRIERGLSPYPDPPKGTKPPPLSPPNVADPDAAAREFLGLVDDQEVWQRATARLALELARERLAKQALHKEVEYRAIHEFVALAPKKSRHWNRKRVFSEAMHRYGVSKSTVERALKECAKDEKLALIARLKVSLTK